MNSHVRFIKTAFVEKQQIIKWAIYILLLINFALYIRNDWQIAVHTMRNGGSFLTWTGAFATSIDELAWFALLFLFELETYVLSDEVLDGATTLIIHSIRIICYVFLAHTLYAYGVYIYDLHHAEVVQDITTLCQLVGTDISFARNLLYSVLDQSNCQTLSNASQFIYVEPELVVTDSEGMAVEKYLAWIDLIEAAVWLLILFSIELMVRLQNKNITKGSLVRVTYISKKVLYSLLWFATAYWIYKGQLMFAWDEFLWIAGFIAIEMNVAEWREEIEEAESI
jgi:hypothetical protein